MDTISIITPVYNGEKYLQAAIDSVLAQTYPNWELIVIDDGSTDSTPEILDRYSDSRIRKVRQENRGEAVARNTGLDLARGSYIAFLDADDVYLPNALADLAGFLDQHPEFDVAYSNGYICDESLNRLMELSEIRPGFFSGNILEKVVLYSGVVTVPVCTITRRDAIQKTSSRFDKDLVIGPDWDFWIQLARHVPFGYLDKITCCYRIHSANITRTSGLSKRKLDLIRGRLKLMHSAWFQDLSLATRREFFYTLLLDYSNGLLDVQKEILASAAFKALPENFQTSILRQLGIACLSSSANTKTGLWFLEQALSISPGDQKSRMIRRAYQAYPPAIHSLICIWRLLHQAVARVTQMGKRTPKEVPSSLQPAGK